ncbi:MAG: hypothetical protein HON92_13790 [Planctomycetaceae bacterium]|nr:hypothetical protein [Planctomycetaceae bacterium]MBT5123305.1 hypothetical protein [Planctomycetaceae bacterium]MBT5883860.1 hypothetical protein [Planctomycetaceae bacterium]
MLNHARSEGNRIGLEHDQGTTVLLPLGGYSSGVQTTYYGNGVSLTPTLLAQTTGPCFS